MEVHPADKTSVFQVPVRVGKRKAQPVEAQHAKKARCKKVSVDSASESSDCGSGSNSDGDDIDYVNGSAPTPSTPISSNASLRHPSDLHKTHHCPYEECSKYFNRPAKLIQHLRSHTNTRPFVCTHTHCAKDFLRESHLKHHVKSAHSDVRDYVCEWEGCDKSFITATRLRRHHAAHEGREKFRCTLLDCGRTFRKHATLQKHVLTFHEGGYPFVCVFLDSNGTTCGEGFNTEGQMKSHAGRIHGTKTFLCTICASKGEASHQQADAGESNVTFSTHADLQAHVQNEHPPTCVECGLKCTSRSGLKSHVEVVHGGLELDERRIHVCQEMDCGRAFTKRGNLNAHIQISHAGKRFVCGAIDPRLLNDVEGWDGSNACGAGSTSKRNLERHVRIVHLGLESLDKSKKKKEESKGLATANPKKSVSALTRLTGAGYDYESGRNMTCMIRSCNDRSLGEHDLPMHLQSHHELSTLGSQQMLSDFKLSSRPTLQGPPNLATDQDLEADRVFDMQFRSDVTMGDSEESLEAGSLEDGHFWLGEQRLQTVNSGDERLQDEVNMQYLIDEVYSARSNKGIEGSMTQGGDMIDPSLK